MSIILASASPRRKELREMLGVKDMKIIPAKGEEAVPEGLAPGPMVELLALQKAREVRQLCSQDDIVIAADTIVWHNERVYGKPYSRQEAEQMLKSSERFPVSKIAYDCGLNDSNYFSEKFKQVYGMPPMKYRGQHMKNGK